VSLISIAHTIFDIHLTELKVSAVSNFSEIALLTRVNTVNGYISRTVVLWILDLAAYFSRIIEMHIVRKMYHPFVQECLIKNNLI